MLRDCKKILGIDHPETLTSLNNLATVIKIQKIPKKSQEAERLFQRGLSGREKTPGKEHPGTLTSFDYLAKIFGYQKSYEEAERL